MVEFVSSEDVTQKIYRECFDSLRAPIALLPQKRILQQRDAIKPEDTVRD